MSSSQPQALSSLSSVSALGICFPDSILAIVGWGTPDFSASCRCVRPADRRAPFTHSATLVTHP